MDADDETVDPEITRLTDEDVVQELSPSPDRSLAGYSLGRELGRGGMGVVYEARETDSGQTVALKVVDVVGRGFDLDVALHEARAMARVSHPNTVFLYRAERKDSGLLLAMELLSGGTLQDLLKREGRLPYRRAVEITQQLIRGLAAFDAHGIVHRDIKPSNCFVTADGTVKIGDLGISRSSEAVGQRTMEGRFVGTPLYSSPEQLRGEPVDRRSDVYSLAATLYEMLTGRPPITAPDGVTLIARLVTDEPAAPSSLVPEIPRGLDRIVLSALGKRPQQRPGSYAELAEALAPYGEQTAAVISLGRRALALLVDLMIVTLGVPALMLVPGFWTFASSVRSWLPAWDSWVPLLLYFGLFALFWDRTPGSGSLGLRVTNLDGGAVRRTQALLRAAIKTVPLLLILLPTGRVPGGVFLGIGSLLLLLSTARKRNGYRCLHDMFSGTRVVHQPAGGLLFRRLSRRRRDTSAIKSEPPASTEEAAVAGRSFGNFVGQRRLATDEAGELWQTDDPLLERAAWIRLHAEPQQAVSVARREMNRPGRLRWIAAGESEGRPWDAFEAPSYSRTLWELPQKERRKRWRDARPLLGMLAAEVEASRSSGTLPPVLSLSQLVLSPDGALLLLDRPLDAGPGDGPERLPADDRGLLAFLRVVIATLVTGRPLSSEEATLRRRLSRLPVQDHEILRQLWDPDSGAASVISRMARELTGEPPVNLELTRSRRFKQILTTALTGAVAYGLLALLLSMLFPDRTDELRTTWSGAALAGGFAFLPPIVSGVLFRGGLALSVDGVQVYRLDASPAGSVRCAMRTLPLGLAVGLLAVSVVFPQPTVFNVVLWLLVAAAFVSVISPSRNLGDVLAGTCLLPHRKS